MREAYRALEEAARAWLREFHDPFGEPRPGREEEARVASALYQALPDLFGLSPEEVLEVARGRAPKAEHPVSRWRLQNLARALARKGGFALVVQGVLEGYARALLLQEGQGEEKEGDEEQEARHG